MPEWTVVTVLVTLVGLICAIIRPILALSTAITKNTLATKQNTQAYEKLDATNTKDHEKFSDTLQDHEIRLTGLEEHRKEE